MGYSPIALFVYNRPEHTRQTIEALINNIGAECSDLYIYSDAPKTDKDRVLVDTVRKIIKETHGFNKIEIIEGESNQGLSKSIIDGVTSLCEKYGKVIVVEDDLITSKLFLDFMNKALDKYENNDSVMHVSGYMFPIEPYSSESFFLPLTSSWGWGTWRNSWKAFEPNGVKLYERLKAAGMFYKFNINNTYNYKRMLEKQIRGGNDSWAVRWYASVFLKNGLGLFPANSHVRNIGLDNSGVHCSATNDYDVKLLGEGTDELPSHIEISRCMFEKLTSYYQANHVSLLKKIFNRLKKMWLS